jgi:hypothetical protein
MTWILIARQVQVGALIRYMADAAAVKYSVTEPTRMPPDCLPFTFIFSSVMVFSSIGCGTPTPSGGLAHVHYPNP